MEIGLETTAPAAVQTLHRQRHIGYECRIGWKRWVNLPNNQNSALFTLVDHKAKSGTAAAMHSYLRRIVEARKINLLHLRLRSSLERINT
jgi:hypothetical protein